MHNTLDFCPRPAIKDTNVHDVRSKNKYTKRSSVLLLSLVYLFSERTLKEAKTLLS